MWSRPSEFSTTTSVPFVVCLRVRRDFRVLIWQAARGISLKVTIPSSTYIPPRNYLLLCGSHGVKGTCHDGFDSHKLALIPSVGLRPTAWTVLSCYEGWKNNRENEALPQNAPTLFYIQQQAGLSACSRNSPAQVLPRQSPSMRQDPAICGYSGCNSRSLKDREPAWKCVLGVFRAHFWASGVRWKSKSGTSCRPGCRSATQEKAFQQSLIDRRHFAIAAEKGLQSAPGVLSPKPQGLDGTEKRGWYLGCQREWHQFAWIQVECWWASEGASEVGARLEVFEGGLWGVGVKVVACVRVFAGGCEELG